MKPPCKSIYLSVCLLFCLSIYQAICMLDILWYQVESFRNVFNSKLFSPSLVSLLLSSLTFLSALLILRISTSDFESPINSTHIVAHQCLSSPSLTMHFVYYSLVLLVLSSFFHRSYIAPFSRAHSAHPTPHLTSCQQFSHLTYTPSAVCLLLPRLHTLFFRSPFRTVQTEPKSINSD